MSDEDSLGNSCCLRRRTYVLILAIGFLVYGLYNALYYITYGLVSFTSMTPSHCSGPRCNDILTCDATRETTYHLRISIITIGSLVFGISGVNAIMNKYGEDTFKFGCWLVAAGVVYVVIMLIDGAYLVLCGNHYSYNTVAEALLWPVPDLPVSLGIKFEIRQLNSYPKNYVDSLCYHNVVIYFILFSLARTALFFHAAYQSFILSERFHYGIAGMGATFSIEGWQKRLALRDEMREVSYNTLAMAKTTGMDLGWVEDEYKDNREPSTRQWYRGIQPSAATRAYDGFSDDRRNVLL